MGYGNHLPPHVNLRAPAQKRKTQKKITLNFHIRSGKVEGAQEDARLAKELDALPHVTVKATLVSENKCKSLQAPYIVDEDGRKIRGNELREYLNNIK